jgi:hypothetical protein
VPARPRVFDDDVVDGAPPNVVVAAEVGARAEQAAQRAIIESG